MVMPVQKPGKSEQVVCTPKTFLYAVHAKLGIDGFEIDLAADKDNTVAAKFYSEENSAFNNSWCVGSGWNWLNPPYEDIKPWCAKAIDEAIEGAKTAMLVPASVGSNWWRDKVNGRAHVLFLNGRLTFVGHTSPYPKDLALLLYYKAYVGGYNVWNWREE